jgi:hypothetical protein
MTPNEAARIMQRMGFPDRLNRGTRARSKIRVAVVPLSLKSRDH